ncbi:MAG: HoxN/HupN/NixA family nickel/cobalt transporter [Hyphomicrobiales bacterium]|nr:HoxN/HupN/NixA family nickel/cobalt transporter [Hyphomicrobiales bacterium]
MLWHIFDDAPERTHGKVAGLYVILIAANVAAWLWAWIEFRDNPLLLGTAFLAYSFGLRHAFDADHIAAIDNITRKLMQEGRRPIAAGFFFSLGHSSVVVGLVLAIALTTTALQDRFDALKAIGSVIGTSISAVFLLAIAAANIVVLIQVYRALQAAKRGGRLVEEDVNQILSRSGLLGRLFRPAFALIGRSWHAYPLGFLFGLGFDTATEIGLLGISAAQAAQGLSIWSILVFPALFTAGMSLLDATDSTVMVGTYGWAFVRPIRKLYYNMTITLASVVAASAIGGIEALGLIGGKLGLEGPFWRLIAALGDNFGLAGYAIVAFFIASWGVSYLLYKAKGYDRIEAASQAGFLPLAKALGKQTELP